MESEYTPKALEDLNEERLKSNVVLFTDGADFVQDKNTDKKRLHLTDDQMAAMVGENEARKVTGEVAAGIREDLPEKSSGQAIQGQQRDLFPTSTEKASIPEHADALYNRARLLYLEVSNLIEAKLADPKQATECEQEKRRLNLQWKKMMAATHRIDHAHPAMNQEVRQKIQREYIQAAQQTIALAETIRNRLIGPIRVEKNAQELGRPKDIGQLLGDAQSLHGDIKALVTRRRLAAGAGHLSAAEQEETRLSEMEFENQWSMLMEEYHAYNALAEQPTVQDRDKLLATMNFVVASFEKIKKRIEYP